MINKRTKDIICFAEATEEFCPKARQQTPQPSHSEGHHKFPELKEIAVLLFQILPFDHFINQ